MLSVEEGMPIPAKVKPDLRPLREFQVCEMGENIEFLSFIIQKSPKRIFHRVISLKDSFCLATLESPNSPSFCEILNSLIIITLVITRL